MKTSGWKSEGIYSQNKDLRLEFKRECDPRALGSELPLMASGSPLPDVGLGWNRVNIAGYSVSGLISSVHTSPEA